MPTDPTLVDVFSTGTLHADRDGFLYGRCADCDWRTELAPHWADLREITTAVDMHHYDAHEVTS